ncbi:hypothetical protein BDQ17DRAFT_1322218 [Cyathus striatus]|nr:hypothetical protein BDQ17DRAFT_1322218 [Cyathus striatus]
MITGNIVLPYRSLLTESRNNHPEGNARYLEVIRTKPVTGYFHHNSGSRSSDPLCKLKVCFDDFCTSPINQACENTWDQHTIIVATRSIIIDEPYSAINEDLMLDMREEYPVPTYQMQSARLLRTGSDCTTTIWNARALWRHLPHEDNANMDTSSFSGWVTNGILITSVIGPLVLYFENTTSPQNTKASVPCSSGKTGYYKYYVHIQSIRESVVHLDFKSKSYVELCQHMTK